MPNQARDRREKTVAGKMNGVAANSATPSCSWQVPAEYAMGSVLRKTFHAHISRKHHSHGNICLSFNCKISNFVDYPPDGIDPVIMLWFHQTGPQANHI